MAFTTAKRNAKPIVFTIDGDEYTFTPPKKAEIFLDVIDGGGEISVTKKTFDWLGEGLGEEQTEKVIARLKNPKDDFDIENIEAIIEWLQEKTAGRPTT